MADAESAPKAVLEDKSEKEQTEVQDKTVDVTPVDDEKEPTPKESAKSATPSASSILLDLVSSDSPDAPSSSRPEKRVYTGVCQWFDLQRGFGFIRINESEDAGIEQDIWVHKNNIQTEKDDEDGLLEKNQECKFEISSKGDSQSAKLSAQNVVPGPRPKREKKPRHKGVCLWFDDSPGKTFGFIEVQGTGQEIFVHADAIKHGKPKLVEGQTCDFEIVEQVGGRLRAHNVNPGKPPPVDPEFVRVRTGKVARWIEERGFGFIRPDNDKEEEVMVRRGNLKTTQEDLVEGQFVKYKVRKRSKRRGKDGSKDENAAKDENADRLEAWDVVPGEIPKKQIFHGIVKFFDREQGFGFIARKNRNEDYFVHKQQIVSSDEEVFLEEGQHVTFVASIGRNRKPRAVDVIPGAKVDEQGKVIEVPEEDDFDPYLPSHDPANRPQGGSKAKRNAASSPAVLPEHEGLSEAERIKKEFNWRKKQRRKRAQIKKADEPASPDSRSQSSNDDEAAPKQPASSSSPKADSPASRPSKKQKKAQAKAAAAAAAASIPESKEKEPEKPTTTAAVDKPKQGKSAKAKSSKAKSSAQPVEEKALFRKNTKQNKKKKRTNAAELRRRRQQEEREQEAISDHFDKSSPQKDQGFISVIYVWILNLCKKTA